MLITPAYRALQQQMHAKEAYGHSGRKWAYTVAGLALMHRCSSILDYGCGTGAMIAVLAGLSERAGLDLELAEYDPGVPGKDAAPKRPADLVTCIDVLEHIEAECLPDVIEDIAALCTNAIFFVISTRPAGKTLPDGRNAHLIVQNTRWWSDRLASHGLQFTKGWEHTQNEWCSLWAVT